MVLDKSKYIWISLTRGILIMESKDFGLPVYLNQASIFDLLSIIDDGFSNFSTIKTIASNENQNSASINGEVSTGIGIKNIFSLINIGLK
jgi:hypothetical protein